MNPGQGITFLFTWIGLAAIVIITAIVVWTSLETNPRLVVPIVAEPGYAVVATGTAYDEITNSSKLLVFEIPAADCAKQQIWDPATQELPTPMNELQRIAFQNCLGSDELTWATWKATNVTFERLGYTETQETKVLDNRWSCVMTLTNQDPAHYDYKTACVLLDGTYVAPQGKSADLDVTPSADAPPQ